MERFLARGGGGLNDLAYSFQLDTEIHFPFQVRGATHVGNFQDGHDITYPLLGRGQGEGSSRRVMLKSSLDEGSINRKCKIFTVRLNLFQHLTSLQYSFQACEILNQVQDDNLTMEGLLCFP